jgi:hypothetical protein
MAKNVNQIIDALPVARRRKIEKQATHLIAEEMALQKLQRAREITQVRIAKQGVTQK